MSLVRWVALAALAVAPGAVAANEGAAASKLKAGSQASAKPVANGEAQPAAGRPAKPKFKYALEMDREQRLELADKLRDELIAQLENDIIPKFEQDNPQRPDLIFQLSEYYWEKFRFLYAQEEKANDAAWKVYRAREAKGEKGLKAPRVDHSESARYRARTMALYEQILKEHPKFEKTDQVLFSLGSNLQDVSDVKQDPKLRAQAAKRYEELIKRFPESRLVPDTYVQLGDYYFDTNRLDEATANYQKALASKVPKIYSYALYKLAWCDFNYGTYGKGLGKLHQVVEFAESQGRRMVDLRNEALSDLVLFYTQLDQPSEAIAYFEAKTTDPQRSKLVGRLGEQLASAGYYDHSTQVFRKLIAENPMRPEAPGYQQAIVTNYEQLRQRQKVQAEVKVLAETYHPGSDWWRANEADKGVLRDAFEVSETATRNIVTEYHSEAQKTSQVQTFRLTRDLYKQYIDAFASSEDPEFVSDSAFNMLFYYGQILWGLEEWEAAADAYDRVVSFKIPSRPEAKEVSKEEYRKLAAFASILAYDKLIKIERGELTQHVLKDGQRIREDKDKGGMTGVGRGEKREVKDAKPEALTRFEQKMIAASDAYAKLPQALREPKDEVEIRANAALIFFDKNHFPEAEQRFAQIIDLFPGEKRAQEAADLTMYVMEGQERWEELRDAAARFLTNKALARPGTEFAQRVGGVLEGASYKWIDEVIHKRNNKPLVAAEQFLRFVEAYPKAKTADKAMTYSMLLFRDAGQLDRAIEVGERTLAQYRGSPLEPKVRFTLAKLYEGIADFRRSAEMNEAFVASQARLSKDVRELEQKLKEAKRKKAPEETVAALRERAETAKQLFEESTPWVADARFNAGLWWEGLGQTDKAIAAFRGYLQEHPERKDLPDISLRIAALYDREKRWPEALRAYREFEQRYARKAEPGQVFQAKYRQLAIYRETDRRRDARAAEAELIRAWDRLPEKDREDLLALSHYADARFQKVEGLFEAYQKVKLNRVRSLQADLRRKQKLMAELEKAYVEVITVGAGEQAIASLTRIGLAYEDLAKNILESPTPPGLDEEQQAMYRAEIEGLAVPVEEKAIQAFEKALEKAYELKLYGEWTFQAQERINAYRPGAYAQVKPVEFRGAEFRATSPLEKVPAAKRDAMAAPSPAPELPFASEPAPTAEVAL